MVKLSIFNAVVVGSANIIGARYGAFGLALSNLIGLISRDLVPIGIF